MRRLSPALADASGCTWTFVGFDSWGGKGIIASGVWVSCALVVRWRARTWLTLFGDGHFNLSSRSGAGCKKGFRRRGPCITQAKQDLLG